MKMLENSKALVACPDKFMTCWSQGYKHFSFAVTCLRASGIWNARLKFYVLIGNTKLKVEMRDNILQIKQQ